MKRNLLSATVGARKKALRRRNRERMKYVCFELCLRHVRGRFGRGEHFRPTARAAALRYQTLQLLT
ncbi:hypothetical protein GCM10023063_16570 [Arthrobacter methylotrophus]|uniref:Uncharacterized protein n=1 Tax=Arthrobacter methylotrophus TaxID=121291 RepID=A0ABV5UQG3_9MICC